MYIRQEKPEDYVVYLRKSSRYIPEQTLMAFETAAVKDGDVLIGHIMLTHTELRCEETSYRELLLSPLCVALPYRSKGVGGALMKESFRLAAAMGYTAVFLCGDPDYYKRYGFMPAACYGKERHHQHRITLK